MSEAATLERARGAERSGGRRWRIFAWLAVSPVLLGMWLWTTLALYYAELPHPALRHALAWAFILGSLFALARSKRRSRTWALVLAVFAVVAAWHSTLEPSNRRDWHPEVAVLPAVQFDDGRVRVTGLRHFRYIGEEEFDIRYEDRDFDLDALQAVDLLVSYWRGEAIGHTMLSFDFGGDDVLGLSVEVRKERDEAFHPVPGMFKQFELIYVLADERDLLRVRAEQREEDLYLFRTALTPDQGRALLRQLLDYADGLRERPVFYRTLLRNCTTAIIEHLDEIWPDRTSFTELVVMNGYAPEHALEHGILRSELPFPELKEACRITDAARAHGDAPGFSRRIRAHLPVR